MSQSWMMEIPLDKLDPQKTYFVVRRHFDAHGRPHYNFWSRGLSGKETWSSKPGIAVRVAGNENLKKVILGNTHLDLIAFEVPPDADKRWRARKPVRRRHI